MLVKALLFIIILLYVYDTYYDLTKFIDIHLKEHELNINTHMHNKEEFTNYKYNYGNYEHNTNVGYTDFRPLHNKIKGFYNRNNLIDEGIRQNNNRLKNIDCLKQLLENDNIDENLKNNIRDDLKTHKWRDHIFQDVNSDTKQLRNKSDIMTDYNPNIIGCPRRWMECYDWL